MSLRVWHLCSNRWNSAVTEYALSAARSLAAKSWPTMFSALTESPADMRANAEGLDCAPFESFGLRGIGTYLSTKSRFKPDVICLHGGPEATLARIPSGVKRVRFLGQANHRVRSAGHVSAFMVPSKVVLEQAPKERSLVIPLGVDAKRFRRIEGGVSSNRRPVIAVFGRFDPVKGHEHALELCAPLIKNWPDEFRKPCLFFVGREENITTSDLEALVSSHGLELGQDVVISTEQLRDPARFLSSVSLGLVPSLDSEAICRVAQEFLLCGVPLVCSGVGSLEECLIEEGFGASYRDRGADAARALIKAWLEKSLSEGERGKRLRAQSARELFSLEAMGDLLAEKLTRLVAGQSIFEA